MAQHTPETGEEKRSREQRRKQRERGFPNSSTHSTGAEGLTTASFLADASLASSEPAHPPRKSLVTSSAALPPLAPRAMNPSASAAISPAACSDGRLRLGGSSWSTNEHRWR
jgi:hypothetical protein